MRTQRKRWAMGLATAAMFGTLFQTNCISFASDEVQRSVNFCFLFDCQNGALGGLIDFCPNATGDTSTGNTFVDCPTSEN
jgi:hypothetical protein